MTAVVSLARRSPGWVSVDDAVARARQLGRPALYSRVERLPFAPNGIAFLDASSAVLGSGTLWEQPGAGLTFSGAGSAWEAHATGPGRFGQVSVVMRDMRASLRSGMGSVLGGLMGMAAKLSLSVVMVCLFLWWTWLSRGS